jgi:hypothetical protein
MAASAIGGGLPPWLFRIRSRFRPAAATEAPSATQPDRLQGQCHRLGRLTPLRQRREDACQDEAVRPRRQMRPMLLGRGHGKDDDGRIAETGDLRRGHLVPLSQHALADLEGAADHDI